MNTMFAAFLGGWEWMIVLLAGLLLFGAKRIPDLAKGLGQGIKEFKKATKEVTGQIQQASMDTAAQVGKPLAANPSLAAVKADPNSGPAEENLI